jgi:membrane protein implicated in regulation of membrane protease activity
MSTTEVHQLMLALGVLVCPLTAAAAVLGISRRWKRWLVGLLAGLWVAVTPYISGLRSLDPETGLLGHSLLIAVIGLTALLLLALLIARPEQRQQQRQRATNHDSQRFGKTGNILPAVRDNTTVTLAVDDDCLPPLPSKGSAVPVIHIDAEPGMSATTVALADENPLNENRADEKFEAGSRAAEPELDLTATERLYTNSRQQPVELALPENRDWLAQEEADAATDKAIATEPVASPQSLPETISDAEFTEPGNDLDNTLEFGDDLTGEYSHPALAYSPPDDTAGDSTPSTTETPLPTTLEAALENARSAATTMAYQVTELQHGVAELNSIHHACAVEQCTDQLAQANTLHHRQALYAAISETYAAAEAVIAVQHKLLEETTAQRKLIAQKWRLEHARVTVHKQEVDRLREMARDAAQLARRAALAQQNIRDIFIREQTARLKSEKSARRAVRIARNAITALTAEERKNRIPET